MELKKLSKKLMECLVGLRDAYVNNRPIIVSCLVDPPSLDAGKHYFELYYINKHGGIVKFWPDINNKSDIEYISMKKCKRHDTYAFSSGAIGMSRTMDAFGSLSSLLTKCFPDTFNEHCFQLDSYARFIW